MLNSYCENFFGMTNLMSNFQMDGLIKLHINTTTVGQQRAPTQKINLASLTIILAVYNHQRARIGPYSKPRC